ncbi:MAG: HD-GYP domain-containing protein [Candidatus Desulfofervidaceae bacterium]|nr:HD-GYP domain-containing protein [Candidatus Desulfofervidaceae bacterium]
MANETQYAINQKIKHFPQPVVKNSVFSFLSHLTRFPINNVSDLERFLQEVVNETSQLVKAEKVTLTFPKSIRYSNVISSKSTNSKENNLSISLPLITQEDGVILGFLTVDKERGKIITQKEMALLKAISQLAALKIQNAVLQQVIYQGIIETLKVLVNVVEAKDVYTRFHSQRVAQYATSIAEVMGLPQADKDVLKIASLLHDIGKLVIPDNILLKPESLTPEEFEVIKYHPLVGDEILAPLRFFQKERIIIRHHHERWDGSGYPDGLFGEAIPLLARIMAVADCFDAMTSDRIYRKAMSFENAFKKIKSLANIKYDPEVVRAFEFFLGRQYGIKI